MARNMLLTLAAAFALTSPAPATLAPRDGSSTRAALSGLDAASAVLRVRLAENPAQSPQVQAGLARLVRLRARAMASRHIQGGVLSDAQARRLAASTTAIGALSPR